MSWKVIRPQIKTLLDTIDEIGEVSQAPKIKFAGYPAAHVVPSEHSGDYETTTENLRTYSFTVRVFDETKKQGVENALLAVEEVVDAVIDLFDQEDLKTGSDRTVGINLPTGYMLINIWAMPGVWDILAEDQLIMMELSVKVRISRDIT